MWEALRQITQKTKGESNEDKVKRRKSEQKFQEITKVIVVLHKALKWGITRNWRRQSMTWTQNGTPASISLSAASFIHPWLALLVASFSLVCSLSLISLFLSPFKICCFRFAPLQISLIGSTNFVFSYPLFIFLLVVSMLFCTRQRWLFQLYMRLLYIHSCRC